LPANAPGAARVKAKTAIIAPSGPGFQAWDRSLDLPIKRVNRRWVSFAV
jgi:hypothetical protein